MKSLFELTKVYPKSRPGNPITDLIQEFQKEVNLERPRLKQLPFVAIRIKLSHLNEESLRTFMNQCKDYKNRKGSFSKCFFGALKVK